MTTIRTKQVPAQIVFYKEGRQDDVHIVFSASGPGQVRLIDPAYESEWGWTLEEARDVYALLRAMFDHVDKPPEKGRLPVDG